MTPSAPLTIASLDVPMATLAARLRAGRDAEQRHLLIDADPDSKVPTFPYLTKTPAVAR
jgi:hypothetical protein